MNSSISYNDNNNENKNTQETMTNYYYYYCQDASNSNQEDHDMEDSCYQSYDAQMAQVVAEADYQDYYYNNNQADDEEYSEDESTGYDYRTDSLLSLVVGVQSYLSEQTLKNDSPLHNLQYKMYTYMRQRALELGVQF